MIAEIQFLLQEKLDNVPLGRSFLVPILHDLKPTQGLPDFGAEGLGLTKFPKKHKQGCVLNVRLQMYLFS